VKIYFLRVFTSVLGRCEWLTGYPSRFTPGQSAPKCPLNRRLCWSQSQSGWFAENRLSRPAGTRNPILRSSSPYPSRHTNYAISYPGIPQCANMIAFKPVTSSMGSKTSKCIFIRSRKSPHRLLHPLCRQYGLFLLSEHMNLLKNPNLNCKFTHAVKSVTSSSGSCFHSKYTNSSYSMQSSEVSSELFDIILITNVTIIAHSHEITLLPSMTPTALTARIIAFNPWH